MSTRHQAYGAGAHIVCDNLIRIYRAEKVEVVALQGLDLLVDHGELVAVIGASGSGKSTLLNILSGLDQPTAGLARVGDQDLLTMSGRQRLRYRRHVVGFVWQQTARNLVPYLSAADNVALPLLASRTGRRRMPRRIISSARPYAAAARCVMAAVTASLLMSETTGENEPAANWRASRGCAEASCATNACR